ncbi:MAG: hypothetical protein OEM59_06855, partial [Rhodospirillales bacterium]|nr:hypothetical protein [Rhodospirillales bacterium]
SDLAHKLIVGVEAMGHAPDGLNRFACVMHCPLNPTRIQEKNLFQAALAVQSRQWPTFKRQGLERGRRETVQSAKKIALSES